MYRTALPDAARSLAKTLGIPFDQTRLSVRTNARRVDLGKSGWTVRNREGVPITKPFRTREQAEHLADQTGEFVVVEVPVLWTMGMQTIRAIPLYGTSVASQWFQAQVEPTESSAYALTAGPKGVLNA